MTNEIEQAVLGGLLNLGDLQTSQAGKVFAKIKPSSFVGADEQMIFEAMRRLASKDSGADPFTVDAECKSDRRYRDGIFEYLCELITETTSAANVHVYADQLRDKAIQRFASNKLQESIALINDPTAGTITERLGLAESLINQIQEKSQAGQERGLRHVHDIGRQWSKELSDRLERGLQTGYTLGIEALDGILAPKRVPEGSLVVIGARPKIGKTACMSSIIEHFAIHRKEAVAAFSLEMPGKQMYERLIVGRSKIDPNILYRKPDQNTDFGSMSAAVGRFEESNLYIDDTPGITLSHIKREARKLNRKNKVGLIAVDYLTLMQAEKAERNDLGYGLITKGLKNLAKELNCVVLMLTQLNRKLEDRGDKRPMPSDSRDTGQIEQDCDVWIGLYRESVYNQDFDHEGLTEIIVRLNRHGDTGTAYADMRHGSMQTIDQDQAREWAQGAIQSKPRKPKF